MISEYPKLKPLEIEDREEMARHLKLLPRRICELSLGNIFIWEDFDRPQLTLINGNLCLLINPPNETSYFLEPLGRNKVVETLEVCLKHAGRVSRVPADYIALLPKDHFSIAPLRNQFDYIYETKVLAELKGKKFDGKRNRIKQFQRHSPNYEYFPLTPACKKESLALFEKWFAIREESKFYPRLAHTAQREAVISAFNKYEKLNLIGGAVMVEKKLKGFTIGSFLNPELASVHFAYGDPELPGIAQTLLWEACNKTYHAFKYVDLEQDLGIPGLRTAKLSYQPLKLEEKFEVKFS